MANSGPDHHFLTIWRKALKLPSIDNLSPDLVNQWAAQQGLGVEHIDELDIGAFGKTRSIVLTAKEGRACFPKIHHKTNPDWEQKNQIANKNAALWEKVEWFVPFWVPMMHIQKLLTDIENCPRDRVKETFNFHTSTIYTLAFQAVCIAQIMPKASCLQEFSPLAREAYLAFYSGYRASSIAALIPAIEGALSRISSEADNNLTLPDKIDRIVSCAIERAAHLHFEQMWTPREYLTTEYLLGQDERVFAFETLRRWLRNYFFCATGKYDGVTWLNRHLFAHATSSSWQDPSNISRLIVALATLGIVESWHDGSNQVSPFFPEMNEDSKLLWQQALFQGNAQMVLNNLAEKQYHKHGRLVPEMPTDDGVTLRKAILAEDCINDLIRPLRDAGWSVDIKEPDERGLYMTVIATSGTERFGVAFLYSCATANEIYRKLSESAEVIVYRGAPYHQDQYAYGLNIHVGPVTGWQPPLAPNH
ncbi:MAG: hypothetical protein ACXW1W_02025 [Methylococcaceae bacterium]